MNRKFIVSSSIITISVLFTYFLPQYPVVLALLLIGLAYVKYRIYPVKKEFLWFCMVAVGGGIVEVILVNSGSTWSYRESQLLGIPIWIPFFWGTLATTIIVMYEGLTSS